MEFVLELLGNYAFPICMCIAMCYIIYDMSKRHSEESKDFVDAINGNTNVLEKILMLLDNMNN